MGSEGLALEVEREVSSGDGLASEVLSLHTMRTRVGSPEPKAVVHAYDLNDGEAETGESLRLATDSLDYSVSSRPAIDLVLKNKVAST